MGKRRLNARMLHDCTCFLLGYSWSIALNRSSHRSHPHQGLFLVVLILWQPSTTFHTWTWCCIPANKKAVSPCLEPQALMLSALGNGWVGVRSMPPVRSLLGIHLFLEGRELKSEQWNALMSLRFLQGIPYKDFWGSLREDMTKHGWIDYWPSNANKPVIKHCLVIMLLLGKLQMRR